MTEDLQEALNRLASCSEEERDHFAVMLCTLANCYGEDSTEYAVLLHSNEEKLQIFSVNAKDMKAAELVSQGYDFMNMHHMRHAPPKELFN
jgi:hypothetical protein